MDRSAPQITEQRTFEFGEPDDGKTKPPPFVDEIESIARMRVQLHEIDRVMGDYQMLLLHLRPFTPD